MRDGRCSINKIDVDVDSVWVDVVVVVATIVGLDATDVEPLEDVVLDPQSNSTIGMDSSDGERTSTLGLQLVPRGLFNEYFHTRLPVKWFPLQVLTKEITMDLLLLLQPDRFPIGNTLNR